MIQHKGYIYQPWEDIEEDNIKIFHDVLTPEGKKISIPLSPYCSPNQLHFEKWVELGCPTERLKPDPKKSTSYNWGLKDIEETFSRKF